MDHKNPFGFRTFCDQENDDLLNKSREIDKLGFAIGTTIIALIPVLISVQRLPTASIHELVLRNYDGLAIITAGLTFGLPVIQKSSDMAVKAADYLKEDFSRNGHDRNNCIRTRCNKHIFSGVFALFQLLLVLMIVLLNRTTFKSGVRTLWGCRGSAHTVWHVGFLLPIPVIGIVWYFFLRWTHYTDSGSGTHGPLIIYRRRRWVESIHPFTNLLPGLAQMLMTVYFTFMFSTMYGVSVLAALVRVMTVAAFLFISRMASLWFAKAASERDSRLIVRCESEDQIKKVQERWNEQQQLDWQQSSPRQLPMLGPSPGTRITTLQPTPSEPSTELQTQENELPSFPTTRESVPPEQVGGTNGLGKVVKLMASPEETIEQQGSIIETIRTEIASIKEELEYLKSHNAELQQTIGSSKHSLASFRYRLHQHRHEPRSRLADIFAIAAVGSLAYSSEVHH